MSQDNSDTRQIPLSNFAKQQKLKPGTLRKWCNKGIFSERLLDYESVKRSGRWYVRLKGSNKDKHWIEEILKSEPFRRACSPQSAPVSSETYTEEERQSFELEVFRATRHPELGECFWELTEAFRWALNSNQSAEFLIKFPGSGVPMLERRSPKYPIKPNFGDVPWFALWCFLARETTEDSLRKDINSYLIKLLRTRIFLPLNNQDLYDRIPNTNAEGHEPIIKTEIAESQIEAWLSNHGSTPVKIAAYLEGCMLRSNKPSVLNNFQSRCISCTKEISTGSQTSDRGKRLCGVAKCNQDLKRLKLKFDDIKSLNKLLEVINERIVRLRK